MRPSLFVALAVLIAAFGCSAPVPVSITPGWHLYRNLQHGYELQTPDGYDVREIGLEGQRSAASIRISLHEYQALTPALELHIQETASDATSAPLGIQPRDLSVALADIEVNGLPARQAEYRWKANGDLAFVEIRLPGALFYFLAGPHTRDFHATDWWRIVSTFRFLTP